MTRSDRPDSRSSTASGRRDGYWYRWKLDVSGNGTESTTPYTCGSPSCTYPSTVTCAPLTSSSTRHARPPTAATSGGGSTRDSTLPNGTAKNSTPSRIRAVASRNPASSVTRKASSEDDDLIGFTQTG